MPRKPLPVQTKLCARCQAPMERKRFNGRLEDRTVFRRRLYCGEECANAGRRKAVVAITTHRWRARKHVALSCEACGETRSLQVHHCDGNATNGDLSNLQTLCKYCHDFWHALLRRRRLPISGRVPRLIP